MEDKADNRERRPRAATAAYATDGRDNWQVDAEPDSDWHPAFSRLLGSGHIFLGQTYGETGVLFRGMPTGLSAAIENRAFWQSNGDNPLCRLERELGVIFCSEVARDALAVARPWEQGAEDAILLIFASSIFARRWQRRAAAVLGFADVGMVFKYPCFAEALAWSDLYGLVVHPDRQPACQTMIERLPESARPYTTTPAAAVNSRDAWLTAIDELLSKEQQSAAVCESTNEYPRRSG